MSGIEEGDTIRVRGHKYCVESIDRIPDGGIIQYQLEPLSDNAPPAHLKPHEKGHTIVMFLDAHPTVEVDSDD